jgi:anthranilate phosphoribosyltransferase
VRGVDGLDEMSPTGTTRISVVTPSGVTETEIVPEDFGIERMPLSAIRGGNPVFNARALERVLRGEDEPSLDAFVLNAAAALAIAEDLAPKDAARRIRDVVLSGMAQQTLDRWRETATARRNSATVATPS